MTSSIFAEATASARPAEETADRSAAARKATAAFGQIMALILRSPQHQRMTVGELRTAIAPIVLSGQYALAGRRFSGTGFVRPVAAVLWASVSDEVDRRLQASAQQALVIARNEISGGPIVWIVDVFGDGPAIDQLIANLRATRWNGQTVRARALGPDKTVVVQTLGAR